MNVETAACCPAWTVVRTSTETTMPAIRSAFQRLRSIKEPCTRNQGIKETRSKRHGWRYVLSMYSLMMEGVRYFN